MTDYMQDEYIIQRIKVYNCGCKKEKPRQVFKRSSPDDPEKLPVTCVLLKHAQKGYVLFDTGPSKMPLNRFQKFFGGNRLSSDSPSLTEQLEKDGVDPAKIQYIIISHLHPENTGGLIQFDKYFLISTEENLSRIRESKYKKLTHMRQFRSTTLLPSTNTLLNKYFGESYDVFRDDSIWMAGLNGHTKSMLGMYLKEHKLFFVSDAFLLRRQLDEISPLKYFYQRKQWSYPAYLSILRRLRKFHEEHPEIRILPASDIPEDLIIAL
ncbi:MAG: MBL fold metallo-hydrolase [Oscillospiraceae bacterium]|jgi:glyoxylase-like metal-dependent hydrolase (beta-lactamase superfamily II)|nr:MBL fold metallo-hydrolase [Oscillospiraceae bacterium]